MVFILPVFAVQAQVDTSGLAPVVESQVPLQSPLTEEAANAAQAPSANVNAQATSSTSASKQFVVHGSSLKTRSVFCLLADETAASLDRLLKDPSPDRLPVVVVLKSGSDARRSGASVTTNISQLAYGGFHLQVNVQLRQGFHTQDFKNELVRILLAERILRKHKELSSSRERVLPDWLLTGVSQALEFRERAKPSVLFAAVFRSGRIYSIDGVLQARAEELDSMSRSIYQTSCCALILTLLDQPDGPVRFGRFLNALAASGQSDRDLLKEHFPTLGISSNSLEKWWALQMATLATPTSMESLGVAETERFLDEALTLQFHLKNPVPKKESPAQLPSENTSPPQDTPTAEPTDEEKPSWFKLPFFGSRNKDVFFPFLKRNSAGESEKTTEELEAEKADPSKTKTEKKEAVNAVSESPAPAQEPPSPTPSLPKKSASERKLSTQPTIAPSPAAELPRKGEDQRQISDMPELPTIREKKETTSESDVKNSSEKGTLFNPLNWFRKDGEMPSEEQADPSDSDSPAPLPQTQAQPQRMPSAEPSNEMINIPIAEYAQVMNRADRGKILQQNLERLNALKQRAHPLYRDLIGEYSEVVRSLMHGKHKGLSGKLESLSQRRLSIHKNASEVEMYVDWYEANSGGYSNTFDDYLKLQDSIEGELNPRSDSISQYLDLLDKEYQ